MLFKCATGHAGPGAFMWTFKPRPSFFSRRLDAQMALFRQATALLRYYQ